jgi:stage IV sporulation protein FB
VRIRARPSVLLLGGLCLLFGEAEGLLLAAALLCAHEAAHGLAARALGLQLLEIELAPFGGVAQIAGVEQAPVREALVAAAGPLCNLCLAALGGLFAYCLPESTPYLAGFIAANLILCLFNLLPAYPLDGGRLLRALLLAFCEFQTASRVAAGLGLLCGLGVMALSAPVYLASGKWNLSLVLGGLTLFLAALREMRSARLDAARRLLKMRIRLEEGRPVPLRTLIVPEGTRPEVLLRHFKPGAIYRVLVVDEKLRARRESWQWEIQDELFGEKRALQGEELRLQHGSMGR